MSVKTFAIPEAMQYLFDQTWPAASQRLTDISDKEDAWKAYLKLRYSLAYSLSEAANDPATEGQLKHDCADILYWIQTTDQADFMLEINTAVMMSQPFGEFEMPQMTEAEQCEERLRDFIEQASHMAMVVLFGEPFSESLLIERMGDVRDAALKVSPGVLAKYEDELVDLAQEMADAAEVISGVRDVLPVYPSMTTTPDSIFYRREVIGSESWRWWLEMYQFALGMRPGQAKYNQDADFVLMDLQDWPHRKHKEYDPKAAAADPLTAWKEVTGIDYEDRPPFVMPSWMEDFVAAPWNGTFSDEALQRFLAETRGLTPDDD